MMNRFFAMNSSKAAVAALLGCVSALVTGCSMGNIAIDRPDNSPVAGAAIQGIVHGGQNPISGATIQLWAVGSANYGSAATPLIKTVVTTSDGSNSVDSNANPGNANNTLPLGSFTISGDYTCPAAPSNGNGSTYVYITASGGNPGLGTGANPNIMLAAALGSCSNLLSNAATTFITLNEVTTVATSYALGQYFTSTFGGASTDSFGAPNTTQAQVGIANAFATVNNMVTLSTGSAVTSAVLPNGCTLPGTATNPCVTATPESAKLYAIANILAACVNSNGGTAGDGSSCGQLFGDVVTTSGTAPSDTLQAAVYMNLNPTSNNSNGSTTNLAALCNLQATNAPFPNLNCNTTAPSQQPTDWTIGIQYTDQTAGTFFLQPQNIAADSNGNIWVLNSSGSTSNGSLVEVGPTGVPEENTLTSATAGTGINAATPRNLAIDTNNDAWVTTSTSSAYVFEVSPSGATLGTDITSKSSYGIAIDGNNNVYVGTASTSAHFEIFEFPAADIATPIVYPIASSTPGTAGVNGTNSFVLPEYMAVDTAGNLWMTNGSATTATTTNEVVQLSNINISACNGYAGTYPCPSGSTSTGTPLPTSTTENTYTAFDPATMASPFGIAANTNGVWVANSTTGNDTVTNVSLSGATGATYGSASSIASPRYVAVDGAGNVWVTEKGGAGTSVAEFSSSGTVLSPVNSGGVFTTAGFQHAGLDACLGITIDPSGNVWIANNTASMGVFEVVGAAAPTVTPIALALKNNAVAAKP